MKLALHQPYFFPYIGYFSIINGVDIYVHSDTMQYIRHGWINRNRILCNTGEWKYILVPIKKTNYAEPINRIRIDYEKQWEKKILAQLLNYKKYAPYYENVKKLVEELFDYKYDSIAALNIKSCDLVLRYLSIDKTIFKLSDLNISINNICEPDDWGIAVCKHFPDIKCYWNAPGGDFYNVDKYWNNSLDIKFVKTELLQYKQLRNKEFVPGLSILDVMMFNSPETIKFMLNKFSFIEHNQ